MKTRVRFIIAKKPLLWYYVVFVRKLQFQNEYTHLSLTSYLFYLITRGLHQRTRKRRIEKNYPLSTP